MLAWGQKKQKSRKKGNDIGRTRTARDEWVGGCHLQRREDGEATRRKRVVPDILHGPASLNSAGALVPG
jgi:hypothetical protein